MGKFEKTGLRSLGLSVTECINWIRLYGLKDGWKLFTTLGNKRNNNFFADASFLKSVVVLRNNNSDKPIFKQVFYEKQYDPYGVVFPEAKRIIDGGANIGCASIYFSLKFPHSEIIAIEPEASNFKLLQQNVKTYKNVTCIQKALWNKNESLFIENPDAGAAEYVTSTESKANALSFSGITISEVMQLKNWEEVDVIKLDIEGAEKEIFSDKDLSWLNNVKLLIIELHDRYKSGCTKAVFSALNQFSYDAYFHHENIFIFFK